MKNTNRVLRALRRAQVANIARMRERAAKAAAFDWIEQEEAWMWRAPYHGAPWMVRARNALAEGRTLLEAVTKTRTALIALNEKHRRTKC